MNFVQRLKVLERFGVMLNLIEERLCLKDIKGILSCSGLMDERKAEMCQEQYGLRVR